MKDIIFRFVNKRKDNGEVYFVHSSVNELEMEDSWQGRVHYYRIGVDLFTGLKDKNGTDIYEGDIVKSDKGVYFKILWGKEKANFYGVTPNIYNKKENTYYAKSMPWIATKCVVSGNIHQNHELL